jgi:hypothetical protein
LTIKFTLDTFLTRSGAEQHANADRILESLWC